MQARTTAAIDGGTRGGIAVWLPWFLAPAVLLLPIGGCGVAAAARRTPALAAGFRPAAETVATVEPVVPPDH